MSVRITELRADLTELVNKAQYAHEVITLTRGAKGGAAVVLVNADDYERLWQAVNRKAAS